MRFCVHFLNLLVMCFPKFVYMTKNIPILHVFAPLNNVGPTRVQCLVLKNN